MALTNQEKIKIITDLGHPAKTLLEDSTHFNRIMSDRFENLTPETVACVRELLGRAKDIDERLSKGIKRAGIEKVGDIHFSGRELDILRKERKKVLNELSDVLDIPYKRGSASVNICV